MQISKIEHFKVCFLEFLTSKSLRLIGIFLIGLAVGPLVNK